MARADRTAHHDPDAWSGPRAAPGIAGRQLAELAELGIDDPFMTQAARTLRSGNDALFLLIRNTTTDKVVAALRGAAGTVMRGSFDETNEHALHGALAHLQGWRPRP